MNIHGRPTQDRKDRNIKLRLNYEMRKHVSDRAYKQEISMSEYIRNLIAKDMITK